MNKFKGTDLFYATLSVGALSRGDVLQARNPVLPAKRVTKSMD